MWNLGHDNIDTIEIDSSQSMGLYCGFFFWGGGGLLCFGFCCFVVVVFVCLLGGFNLCSATDIIMRYCVIQLLTFVLSMTRL